MADSPDDPSPDDLRELLRRLMGGDSDVDAGEIASAMGLPGGAAGLESLMAQLRGAVQHADGTINWSMATDQAGATAGAGALTPTDAERSAVDQAFAVAGLWLDESSAFGPLPEAPRSLTRTQWVRSTMPFWVQLAEPVALSIADALTAVFADQAPPELAAMLGDTTAMLRTVCGTIFAAQLGAVVGQLATEVVSGGDVGIPLLPEQQAALLPQNLAAFGSGLEVDEDQLRLYLAVRELAHARLFRHARWLRLGLISAVTDFARGLRIDMDRVQEFAADFDPSDPEKLRDALSSGALIPPKTDAQLAALNRLETTLALVEGWVDVVTAEATARLPRAAAIAETVRRRRASGGPAEQAFASLVGLETRHGRLRDAAALWRAVTDRFGTERRESLWSHPDLLPTASDIDDPTALLARLGGDGDSEDEVDQALQDLLRDEERGGQDDERGNGSEPPPV